jgi:hypothetical protein
MKRQTLADFYKDYFTWAHHLSEYADYLERENAALKKVVEALRQNCQCSWDYITGESPHYFCGRCGKPMAR